MKSIEVKGTARTIAERSSEQARALKAIRKNNATSPYPQTTCATWFTHRTSTR